MTRKFVKRSKFFFNSQLLYIIFFSVSIVHFQATPAVRDIFIIAVRGQMAFELSREASISGRMPLSSPDLKSFL